MCIYKQKVKYNILGTMWKKNVLNCFTLPPSPKSHSVSVPDIRNVKNGRRVISIRSKFKCQFSGNHYRRADDDVARAWAVNSPPANRWVTGRRRASSENEPLRRHRAPVRCAEIADRRNNSMITHPYDREIPWVPCLWPSNNGERAVVFATVRHTQ